MFTRTGGLPGFFAWVFVASGVLLAADPGSLGALGTPGSPTNVDTPGVDVASPRFGLVEVDPVGRRVLLPARVNQTSGIVEYALVTDYGKTHESVFVTEARAIDLQSALLLLNARPAGTNGLGLAESPLARSARSLVNATVRWEAGERTVARPLEDLVALTAGIGGGVTGRLASGPWLFNGSRFSAEGFVAHYEGSLISLIRDSGAILNSARPDQDNDDIHVPAAERLPALGTPVTMILEAPTAAR